MLPSVILPVRGSSLVGEAGFTQCRSVKLASSSEIPRRCSISTGSPWTRARSTGVPSARVRRKTEDLEFPHQVAVCRRAVVEDPLFADPSTSESFRFDSTRFRKTGYIFPEAVNTNWRSSRFPARPLIFIGRSRRIWSSQENRPSKSDILDDAAAETSELKNRFLMCSAKNCNERP